MMIHFNLILMYIISLVTDDVVVGDGGVFCCWFVRVLFLSQLS